MKVTAKKLESLFNITRENALKARRILAGDLDPRTIDAAEQYRRQCHHEPEEYLLKLYALNDLLALYGVEYMENPNDDGEFRTNYMTGYEYLNTSDTYAATILYSLEKRKFSIGSWGDIAERYV